MKDIYRTGVYKITNIIDSKIYIGSAAKFESDKSKKATSGFWGRFRRHKCELKNGTHHNNHLQNAWNKYGKDNFVFEILCLCPPEYCIKLEQWFIDNLKPEYNMCKIAGSALGRKISRESVEKRIETFKKNYYERADLHRMNTTVVKLKLEEVIQIKYLLKDGFSLRDCAKKFNVSPTTIGYIKSGRTWKDVKIDNYGTN